MNENNGIEKFSLEHRPPPNFQSILNVRNRDQAERDKENPPPKTPDMFAVCGRNCAECEFYAGNLGDDDVNGCRGCIHSDDSTDECEIKLCCFEKACENCAACREFPCEKLKDSDAEHEGEDLVRLKSKHDKEYSGRQRKYVSLLCGGLTGFTAGLMLGMLTESTVSWVAAGIVMGIAVPLIIHAE